MSDLRLLIFIAIALQLLLMGGLVYAIIEITQVQRTVRSIDSSTDEIHAAAIGYAPGTSDIPSQISEMSKSLDAIGHNFDGISKSQSDLEDKIEELKFDVQTMCH